MLGEFALLEYALRGDCQWLQVGLGLWEERYDERGEEKGRRRARENGFANKSMTGFARTKQGMQKRVVVRNSIEREKPASSWLLSLGAAARAATLLCGYVGRSPTYVALSEA